jgi:hypothetical protein
MQPLHRAGGTSPAYKANWRCSGASRPTHQSAGLATKQDGSEPVSTLGYSLLQLLRVPAAAMAPNLEHDGCKLHANAWLNLNEQ